MKRKVKDRNKIPAALFQGEEDTDKFVRLYYNGSYVAEKIRKIFESKVISNEVTRIEHFDSGNWPYRRAFQDGYIKGIREVLEYLPE